MSQDENRQSFASSYPEVLVVSGDLGLTQFLTEGLTASGFWMSAVRSGLQALEVSRLRGFDALILDAAIADLPLDTLIGRLRGDQSDDAHQRFSLGVPLLVIAGIRDEIEPYDLEVLAVDNVFVAPFELDDLAGSLKSLVASRKVTGDQKSETSRSERRPSTA